jgi:hypothetical protein
MSLKKAHLRKVLALMFAPDAKTTSVLRSDIRDEIRKARGIGSDGGDFHAPFWYDVRAHVDSSKELGLSVAERIAANRRRRRLYEAMEKGFLDWWDNKRRWTNEASTSHFLAVKGRIDFQEIGCAVRVENVLAMFIGNARNRIIYPYFAEEPSLDSQGARLGLWALSEAINGYPPDELRILDVIRGQSYAIADVTLTGSERHEFLQRYAQLLERWNSLWKEYDPKAHPDAA